MIEAYQKEYELGQRSLIDLLNAQNSLFNASVSLQSTISVSIFADYQLLAAMGHMLDYLKAPKPIDAEPLPTRPFGLFPTKVFPILLQLPSPGSEPLNIGKGSDLLAPGGIVQTQQRTAAIDNRWPDFGRSRKHRSVLVGLGCCGRELAGFSSATSIGNDRNDRNVVRARVSGDPAQSVVPKDHRPAASITAALPVFMARPHCSTLEPAASSGERLLSIINL